MANVTIKEMAEDLGKCEQFIRLAIQMGKYPFAVAVLSQSGKKYSYQTSREGFERYKRGENASSDNIMRAIAELKGEIKADRGELCGEFVSSAGMRVREN